MSEERMKLAIGSLLHDIGKAVFGPADKSKGHSGAGADYLCTEGGVADGEVLDCVRYHHREVLEKAALDKEALAYITYAADRISSAADGRGLGSTDEPYGVPQPLCSIFNRLNGNREKFYYRHGRLSEKAGVNEPQAQKQPPDEAYGREQQEKLASCLRQVEMSREGMNSLLSGLEELLAFVPASSREAEDISLYDHMKMTAAIASCIYDCLEEQGICDYEKNFLKQGDQFLEEEMFLLCSMDVSGIQDFIYTITSKQALRTLRARSFYLEIMMEHIIDCLLEESGLTRANLLYSGGGHCYLILPNTGQMREAAVQYFRRVNEWFLGQFNTSLYVAGAYVPCSGNALRNVPEGSYRELFLKLGEFLSQQKAARYTAEDIQLLNRQRVEDYTRECKVCGAIGRVDSEGSCPMCRKLAGFSQKILYQDYYTVLRGTGDEEGLLLPGGYVLVSDDEKLLRRHMQQEEFVRTYSKNRLQGEGHSTTQIWVGDYTTGQSFEEFAEEAEGINRIGILRADVDNLGHAFVAGFEDEKEHSRYVTLTRTATLSRQLSLFFKLHINQILKEPRFTLSATPEAGSRSATIVYSGGDDVFIAGAWDQIVGLAVDIRRRLKAYTQNTLTLSAGIGVYPSTYPIRVIAEEVAGMEDRSKRLPGKNAVTLFEDGCSHILDGKKISDGTYSWEEFEEEVVGEKYRLLQGFFEGTEDYGKAFLYHLLELIRSQEEKINFARYVYLLSRMEPGETAPAEKKEAYRHFSGQMYRWVKSGKDCRQLKTAIQLYVYMTRNLWEE